MKPSLTHSPSWVCRLRGVPGSKSRLIPVTCDDGRTLAGMMITGVPPPALPDLRLALQLARPARQLTGARERGIAGVAARGRCAAPHQAPAEPGLGRPGSAGRANPAPDTSAAGAPAGHAPHRPALAPPPGHKEVDLPEPHGTAAGQRRDRRAH